jgi:Mrp family chromosome partitioning ATPase
MGKVVAGLSEEVAALAAHKASLAAAVADLQATTGDQASANVRLQELQREADTMHRLYETMSMRLREIEAERHMTWPASSVVVAAQPPRFPSFPRTKMMLTGIFIVSLGGGVGIAFGAGLMAKSFRDIDQVEAETGLPILGIFPRPPRRSTAARMVIDQPRSMQAETIGFVLVNLSRGAIGPGPGRVVMVSSAIPGEGRSSFALALGQRALQAGLSVALLDCDMRSAGASRLAEPPRGANTASVAAGRQLADPAALDTGAPRALAIHSCGNDRHALTVAIGAGAMVRRLRTEYDLLLIDTPAVLAVPDALALAPLVDDAVLVVDMARTPRHSVLAATRAMRRAGIEMTGVVLSKVNLRDFARRGAGEGLYARRGGTA